MALGDILRQETQPQIRNALAQAMAPQQVASGGQGGIGAILTQLQQNPAAIQMLLASGSKLLNPQSFQRPGGRIADAVSTGVSGYNELQTQAEDKAYKKQMMERTANREDRKVDLTEKQLNQQGDQWAEEFGLSEDKLKEQKKLWDAQAAQYRANAEALRAKAEQGGVDNLTGPERMTNNLARIMEANGVPPDRAYTMAFDIYNKASEGKAKALASAAESLAFLASTPKGQQLYESVISQIDEAFSSGTDILESVQWQNTEIAPGVQQGDIEAALTAINKNDGTDLTWDQLSPQQQDRLIKAIQQRKGGGQ